MTVTKFPGKAAALGLMLVLLLATASARAANTKVYRCLDSHLTVVYTDVPCKEGASFDIQTSEADPAAVAKLEKLRDQLDESAAQRISEERRLYAQRVMAYPSQRVSEDGADDGYGSGGYYTYPVAGYGYGGYDPLRPDRGDRQPLRDRDHVQHHGRFHNAAPPPPYVVPRR